MPKSRKHKKSCILTKTGREKLNDALNKKYPKKSDTQLAIDVGLDRGTISKILDPQGQKSVTHRSLKELFSYLDIDLEEDDWTNPTPLAKTPNRNLDQTPQKISYPASSISNLEKFTEALNNLDYERQKFLFCQAINQSKPAGAFLIHGKPDYGQRWLVNQFKYQVPYHTDAWCEPIHIKPHRRDIQNLWQSLAQKLGTSPTPQELIDALYRQWQTSTVILVLHDIDLIAGACLKGFIEQFWQPLVNKVQDSNPPQRPYRLLLFLVDNKNSKSKLEASVSFVAKPDLDQPQIPLALPELEPFDQDVVVTWVGIHHHIIGELWQGTESMETVMGEIVERDHRPISVMRDICDCFEENWDDIAGKLSV